MQRVRMQERIALAARQLDKAVPLISLEPFHDRVDRRRARIDLRRRGAAGRRPPIASVGSAAVTARLPRLRLIGHRSIIIEAAFSRRSEILTLAHVIPNSPTKNPTDRGASPPLAIAGLPAKLSEFPPAGRRRLDPKISVRSCQVEVLRRPKRVSGTIQRVLSRETSGRSPPSASQQDQPLESSIARPPVCKRQTDPTARNIAHLQCRFQTVQPIDRKYFMRLEADERRQAF